MIRFEQHSSTFYENHKAYCQSVELNLSLLNGTTKGFCNSFGFELESDFDLTNLKIHIKIFKHQTTQNGIIIPKNATEQSGTELHISGLNKNHYLKIGRSVLKRIISSKENRRILPKPYFINLNDAIDKNSLNKMADFIIHFKIENLVLFNGSLHVEMPHAIETPSHFINELINLMTEID